jgi:hypothetical protein
MEQSCLETIEVSVEIVLSDVWRKDASPVYLAKSVTSCCEICELLAAK